MIATENICPHCGKSVQTTALHGICPECMLKAGLAAETGEIGPDGTVVAKPPLQSVPSVEEIAPHFPQLEILECLGRGGMGAVYKARQPRLDRFVALKILTRRRDSGITDTEFAARFQQEARALARLNHPDIVAVYDFGEAGGYHYLLMEFVDGLTLRQLLQTKKISPEEALAIVPKICEALQFAHERGIVHRDIKPENILLDKHGQVKIADFGIAKILGAPSAGASLTGAKDVIGTPHYMAPEQIEKPTKVDHRADIYSLGVVFYEMLTGELPLGKFRPPSSRMGGIHVDVRLDEVVLHALEKEPERRYQHASEVKTDLETISASKRATGPQSAVAPTETSPWQPPILLVGALLSLALLLAATILPRPANWIALLFGSFGVIVAALKLAGLWPFPSPIFSRSNFTGRNLPANRRVPGRGSTRTADPDGQLSKWVIAARWSARVLGTLLLAFYGVFILAEGLPALGSQPGGVQLNFVALALMLLGFVVGWKLEGAAALLIASGWTLWQISESSIRWNLFQTPLPVAALYGFYWWATHGRRTRAVATVVVLLAAVLGLGRLFVPTNVFIRGSVIDASTGRPVPDAELTLQLVTGSWPDENSHPNARSGKDGQFSLYVGWYDSQKKMAVSATGYSTLVTNLGLRALGQRNVNRDFQLQPAMNTLDAADPPVPPVIVRTVPESGAADVDPALAEIRITFSEPMQDGSWSWTKWGEDNFPEITGQAKYLDDQRTCVLPVRLQPGRVYAIWLNSEYHQDFKNRRGQSAVPYLLIFETRK